MCSINKLSLKEVDILVYDFTFTKARHLRKLAIKILNQKVRCLQDSAVGE